jgi:DNA-directed RNA polymerase subunit omega
MTKPSIIDLLDHSECRYTLVVNVAKRARQLVTGAQPLIDTRERKPLVVAIEEIDVGVITYEKTLGEE